MVFQRDRPRKREEDGILMKERSSGSPRGQSFRWAEPEIKERRGALQAPDEG